ncbi:MAG: hypothetical protein GWP06_15515, partial [Actinobacteria bacterium]|nr:hypothetical protein [Actinomycetota bacterium]
MGGWIGKSIGGTVGIQFEGHKKWIEIDSDKMFPAEIPANDDLVLQVLWLKVLEEKGPALTSEDLADAWLELCWYTCNEYGIFLKNRRLGLIPPVTGSYDNHFWESGMGCPIRSEIWGYVFPGAPDIAASYAEKDGLLDHTGQSVGAEKMFAAMASMAFMVSDTRQLAEMFLHYLPAGTVIERLTRETFRCYDNGLSLREARERLLVLGGHPEACDSQINVPFTFLGLLYGENDLQKTLLAALSCGYDTDCTMATAGALIGQILGASRIPEELKEPIGDKLVMDIQYQRKENTLTSLARDTARVGVLLAKQCNTGVEIDDAAELTLPPDSWKIPETELTIEYDKLPATGPGQPVKVIVKVRGEVSPGTSLKINAPKGWSVMPESISVKPHIRDIPVILCPGGDLRQLPQRNIFTVTLAGTEKIKKSFGIAGAALWKFLGVYFDTKEPVLPENIENNSRTVMNRPY